MSTPYVLHSVSDSLVRMFETEEDYANITTEAGDQEESKVSREEENVNDGEGVHEQDETIEHNLNGPETEEERNVPNASLPDNQYQIFRERTYMRLWNAGRIVSEMELRDEEECRPLSLADRLLRNPNNHLHPLGLCAYIYVRNNEGQHEMYNLPLHLNSQKQLVVLVQEGDLFNVPFRIGRIARRFNSAGAIPVVVLQKFRELKQISWKHSFAFSRRYVVLGENSEEEYFLEILWSTSLVVDPGQSELDLSRVCSYCLKRAPRGKMFKRCSRCKRAWFCSTACHLLAWDIFHSVLCNAVELCNERARRDEQQEKEQQEQFRFNFPNDLSKEQQEQGGASTTTEISEQEEEVVPSDDQGNQVVSRDDQRNQEPAKHPQPVHRGVQAFRSAVAGGLQPVHDPVDEVQLAADIEAMNLNEVLNGEGAIMSNEEEEEDESYRRLRAELDTVD